MWLSLCTKVSPPITLCQIQSQENHAVGRASDDATGPTKISKNQTENIKSPMLSGCNTASILLRVGAI